MQKLFSSDKIYLDKSAVLNAGRGVYAARDIKKGEVIEKCPIIEVSKSDTSNLKESILVTYFFYFGKKKDRLALALGFGSLYNHSHSPNAKFSVKPNKGIIEFVAFKNIKKDDEIMFNYSGAALRQNKHPLWFEVE